MRYLYAMKTTYLFLALLIASSCTLEERLHRKKERAQRRMEKIALRYPEFVRKDTLRDTVKIQIPTVRVDTALKLVPGDTVTITKDRLSIRYVTRNDSIFIEGKCKGDTIERIIEIPCDTIIVEKQSELSFIWKKAQRFWWIAVLIAFIAVILRAAKRFGLF